MKLAVTVGDAAGIGPEVLLRALEQPLPFDTQPLVYANLSVLQRADAALAAADASYTSQRARLVRLPDAQAQAPEGRLGVIDVMPEMDVSDLKFGQPQARFARLQLAALERAMDDADAGHVHAITTAPWTKHLFRLIDAPPWGHTEVLARRFEAPHHVMMLAGARLRVALTTVHVPVARVSQALTHERLVQTIETTLLALGDWFGQDRPRVAVCGLNPHAGEHGVMGREEEDVISPAIFEVRQRWPHATLEGPFPADTLFGRFGDAMPYDAVVCMYHDQGLIPLKLLHFGRSANITLGLPIIRTSVDHGSAYDIAGRGVADAGSMRYAMEYALDLVRARGATR